jgi:broad specificity phosphatase PhoE
MTRFYLIRHARHEFGENRLAGRTPKVHLSPEGRVQADRLASLLKQEPISHIFSSPLDRAQETALPLAKELGIEIQTSERINEIDFGEWTGKLLSDLETIPQWIDFNTFRSGTPIPNGEHILQIQTRMILEIERLRQLLPEANVAFFSHGDPIKSVVAYYLGIPLDLFRRIEISIASVSLIAIDHFAPQILYVNRTAS